MRRLSIFVFTLVLTLLSATTVGSQNAKPLVITIRLDNEAITPVTARFVTKAIDQANEQGARCLVIVLDTPGGLVDSTRAVVRAILRSEVPVVVYVAPAGARAASAGVFITVAAHVAAMAPGTNIGAAHPVQVGGLPGSPPAERQPAEKKEGEEKTTGSSSPMEEKILNDTAAWARALAELRGRNADWVSRAVRESISVSAGEAVKEGAVDLVASDLPDLLRQIDGREVQTLQQTVKLQVADANVQALEMWWGERLLAAIASPNLAILLLIFGFYGVLFELYTPGWGVAGTVGILCLLLGFFALAVLPINYVGLALIILALALFVAEAFVTSFGFLTLGGLASLIIGGLMLVDSPVGFMSVSLWMLVPISLATAAITFFLVGSIVRAHRVPLQTGSEAMPEMSAIALGQFTLEGDHYRGTVRTHGELWQAVSQNPVEDGQALSIKSREGLTLQVVPSNSEEVITPIDRGRKKNIA